MQTVERVIAVGQKLTRSLMKTALEGGKGGELDARDEGRGGGGVKQNAWDREGSKRFILNSWLIGAFD